MPQVMQQCARSTHQALLWPYRAFQPELIQRPRHKVHYAERMREAAVLGPLVCEHRKAELFDAAQALEFRRVDQFDQ